MLADGTAREVELEIDGMIVVMKRLHMRREAVTDDRLNVVAEHYKAGGVDQVEGDLSLSRAQAYRLVKQARAKGLIPEPQPNPKRTAATGRVRLTAVSSSVSKR